MAQSSQEDAVEKNEAKLLLGSGKDAKEVHPKKVVKDFNITRRSLLEQFSISIQV